jgi:hypothetical protein
MPLPIDGREYLSPSFSPENKLSSLCLKEFGIGFDIAHVT